MFALLCFFILTACSTTPPYDEQLQSWMGVSEEHLVDTWGVPDNEFMVDEDTKVLTYVKQDASGNRDAYPELIDYQAIANRNFPGPNPDQQTTEYCKISFTVQDSEVTNYSYNGDDCVGNILMDEENSD